MKKLTSMFAVLAICVASVVGCGGVDNSTSKPNVKLPEPKTVSQDEKDAGKDMSKKSYSGMGGEVTGVTRKGGGGK